MPHGIPVALPNVSEAGPRSLVTHLTTRSVATLCHNPEGRLPIASAFR